MEEKSFVDQMMVFCISMTDTPINLFLRCVFAIRTTVNMGYKYLEIFLFFLILHWQINAHSYDVNTVAYADSTSQILYSGGDDGLCKASSVVVNISNRIYLSHLSWHCHLPMLLGVGQANTLWRRPQASRCFSWTHGWNNFYWTKRWWQTFSVKQ